MKSFQINYFDTKDMPVQNGYVDLTNLLAGVPCKCGICGGDDLIYNDLPIQIKTSAVNEWTDIYMPSTGIYEFEWETYYENGEEKLADVQLTAIRVPANTKFVFDYYTED